MIISCPNCAASFKVDPAKIGPDGRTVRCGSCGQSWQQAAQDIELDISLELEEVPAEAAPPVAGPPPEDIDARLSETRKRAQARSTAAAKREQANKVSLPIGWISLAVFLAVLVAGVLLSHERLVALAPAAAPVFEVLGLQQPVGTGLELRDITFKREQIDGRTTLIIDGAIINTSGGAIAVPRLQASLIGPKGDALASWEFSVGVAELPQNGFTPFKTMASEPPPTDKVSIVFVQDLQP